MVAFEYLLDIDCCGNSVFLDQSGGSFDPVMEVSSAEEK